MKTNLAINHDPTAWVFHSWRRFALMPDRETRVVIIPVITFSDWGPGIPLDFEESLTLSLLRKSLEVLEDPERFLVIPPMRFNLRGRDGPFFTLDPETAHAALEDVVRSIAAHGFRKVLFLNSNPANEDFVDCAGRDLRIALGIQPFCINLDGIGLEWQTREGRDHCLAAGRALQQDQVGDSSGFVGLVKSLCALLDEVHAFRALPDGGKIPVKEVTA
jgi:creatinine amidohydrolase